MRPKPTPRVDLAAQGIVLGLGLQRIDLGLPLAAKARPKSFGGRGVALLQGIADLASIESKAPGRRSPEVNDYHE
jgi:hypothetical protein